MTDIEAVLQRIEADLSIYTTHRNAIVMTDDVRALIRCARALAWQVGQNALGDPIHDFWCDSVSNSIDPCNCGADALKKLGELE